MKSGRGIFEAAFKRTALALASLIRSVSVDRDHARNIGEVYETYTCSNNVATLGPRKCVVFQTLLNDEAISAGDWQLIFGAVCVDEKRLLSLNTLVQVIAMPISNPNQAPS
ncbi:hypothetical protein T02_10648 [Trichinella nativa]|uniref:Uncharacterized protein n=1 Tax=Trichinella nativa TaxID=6335 RepID=A0A0V1L679_9BILA|nr:hypothetical protein T06_17059 [Trichinella sp. T6]KRZ55023.1 hypothetical protein T02_10648 [Trichinella nativa]